MSIHFKWNTKQIKKKCISSTSRRWRKLVETKIYTKCSELKMQVNILENVLNYLCAPIEFNRISFRRTWSGMLQEVVHVEKIALTITLSLARATLNQVNSARKRNIRTWAISLSKKKKEAKNKSICCSCYRFFFLPRLSVANHVDVQVFFSSPF